MDQKLGRRMDVIGGKGCEGQACKSHRFSIDRRSITASILAIRRTQPRATHTPTSWENCRGCRGKKLPTSKLVGRQSIANRLTIALCLKERHKKDDHGPKIGVAHGRHGG